MGNVYWNNNVEETILDEFWSTGRLMCKQKDKSRIVRLIEDLSHEEFEAISNAE